MKDFEASTWFVLPRGTPEAIIKKLHDATVAAMETPAVQKQMLAPGTFVVPPERRSTEYCKHFVPKRSRKTARRSGPPACRWSDFARGALSPPRRLPAIVHGLVLGKWFWSEVGIAGRWA